MLNFYELCGYGAGILFASGFIPQIHKSYTTKNMDDISYGWQFIFLTGIILGIIYSVHHELPPIYICSSVELTFMIILILMKVKYSQKKCNGFNNNDKNKNNNDINDNDINDIL